MHSRQNSTHRLADAIATALVAIPLGALAFSLYGWLGVVLSAVGWVTIPLILFLVEVTR